MALLSHLQSVSIISRLSAAKNQMCFLPSPTRGSFFIYIAQCESDTLLTPADKLLLSEFKKLGGHSAISGRWH